MKKISELAMSLIKWSVIISVPVMTIIVFAQVVMRYVFSSPFFWAEELAVFLLIWISCLGSAYAVRTGQNISVEILGGLPPILELIVELVVLISVSIFLAVGAFYACEWCISEWTQRSAALGLRMTWFHSSILVGFGLALFFSVELMVERIRARVKAVKPSVPISGNTTNVAG